jgi:ATP-dependent HslUV protease ATP-binding subunit HslU
MKTDTELIPREIVEQLDKYIIGQQDAKKAVAIALRNRIRRQKVSPELAEDITPKNIIMIGPTGVGKTEIARRLAKLTKSPFIKVEASKFTEVGYVGRDVESMIRDLVRVAVEMVKKNMRKAVMKKAKKRAVERVLEAIFPMPKEQPYATEDEEYKARMERMEKRRKEMCHQVENGDLNDRKITITTKPTPKPPMFLDIMTDQSNLEDLASSIKDSLSEMMEPPKSKSRELTVKDALKLFTEEEAEKLIDMDKVKEEAVSLTENSGIIFLDELDKVASSESSGKGPDVSREGVQRDLLPIIEGSSVSTKYGVVKTDHILFIAAGAFHISKPADLIPELQGRFPIRVELNSLKKQDFVKILTQPKNALLKQYKALMETEDVSIVFTEDAIDKIADYAFKANELVENIGARRLHTIMERLLEDILFKGPELSGTTVTIDKEFVEEKLDSLLEKEDVGKYIL